MKSKYLQVSIIVIVLMSALTSGCICCINSARTSGDIPEPSQQTFPAVTATPVATTVQIATATPVPTQKPTFTPTPLPTPTPEPRSLPTGTIIANSAGKEGRGELSVTNNMGYDTAFIIARNTSPRVPQFGVYIGKYSSYTISGIPDGTYILYYTYGKDWDGDLKKFTQPVAYLQFDDPMKYTTETTDEYIYYTKYTVTLKPLSGGNAEVTDIGTSGFPEL